MSDKETRADRLIRKIRTGNEKECIAAACKVFEARVPVEKALPALIERFNRKYEERVRDIVACTIGGFGPKALPAFPHLLKALGEIYLEDDVRDSIMWALNQLGEAVIPELTKALRDSESSRWETDYLIDVLAGMGERAVPIFIEALGSDNEQTRINAITGLHKVGAKASSAVPALFAIIENHELQWGKAQMAIVAIGAAALPSLYGLALKKPKFREKLTGIIKDIEKESKRPTGVRKVDPRPKDFHEVVRVMALGMKPQVVGMRR